MTRPCSPTKYPYPPPLGSGELAITRLRLFWGGTLFQYLQGQASDTGRIDSASNHCKLMFCSSLVNIYPESATFRNNNFCLWINRYLSKLGHVDADSAFC